MDTNNLFNEWKRTQQSKYGYPSIEVPRNEQGIPLDKQAEYESIMAKYQPPAGTKFADDTTSPVNQLTEEQKQQQINALMEKYLGGKQ